MDLLTILPLVLLGLVFYFLVIRPAKVRQRQQAALVASVQVGATIMTTAGMFGTVVETTPEHVRLEVSPGVVLTMLPAAISKIVDPGPTPDDLIA